MILSFMCLYVLLRVLEAFRQHVEICNYKLQIVSAADNFRRYNKCIYVLDCQSENYSIHIHMPILKYILNIYTWCFCWPIPYGGKFGGGKFWRIDSFRAFGERKFGELIDQPIGYQL